MGAIHELREDYRHYRFRHPEFRILFLLADLVGLLVKLVLFGGFLFGCWYVVSRNPVQSNLVRSEASVPAVKTVQLESAPAQTSPTLTEERVALLREIANNKRPSVPSELVGRASTNGPGQTDPRDLNVTTASSSSSPLAPTNASASDKTLSLASAADDAAADDAAPNIIAAEIDSSFRTASISRQSVQPVVQLESFTSARASGGAAARLGYIETDEIPDIPYVEPVNSFRNSSDASTRSGSDELSAAAYDLYVPTGNVKNGTWLLAQDSNEYTVQVALTVNVNFLASFATKLPSDRIAAIYPEKVNSKGNLQYSLSVGIFPNRRSAQAFLSSLPADLKRYGAHSRRFDEAQANVAAFLK